MSKSRSVNQMNSINIDEKSSLKSRMSMMVTTPQNDFLNINLSKDQSYSSKKGWLPANV